MGKVDALGGGEAPSSLTFARNGPILDVGNAGRAPDVGTALRVARATRLGQCHNRNESLGPHFQPWPRHLLKRPVSQVANPQHLAPKTNAGRGLRVHSPVAPAGGSRVLSGAKGVNPGIVVGPSWATTARSGPIPLASSPLPPPLPQAASKL